MREILFRGKRLDNGEWIEGDLINSFEGVHIVEDSYFKPSNDENPLLIAVDAPTVGQFTGLLDKNEKKVWEGDIVMAGFMHHGEPVTPFPAYIKYNEHVGYWQICYENGFGDLVTDQIYFRYQIEVIGNRFDNPDLLTKTKQS